MRKNVILLSALLVLSTASQTLAQDQTQNPKPATPAAASETERPKTEIDRLVEEARARGEVILGTCLQNCDEKETTQGVENGRVLELPKPEYPAIARAAHVSGQVQVQVIIDMDGTVMAAAAIGGHPLLQAASVEAARQARFAVTKLNGQPVKVTGVITYNFVTL